jgi:hypothetical protein
MFEQTFKNIDDVLWKEAGCTTEIRRMVDAEKSDLFDVLAYIAFALAPITREERVDTHRERIFSNYDDKLAARIIATPASEAISVPVFIPPPSRQRNSRIH